MMVMVVVGAWTTTHSLFNLRDTLAAMNDTVAQTLSMCCYTYVGLPFDVVKLRMQTQGRERVYKGVTDALVRIAKEEGIPALWKGGTPRLAGHLLLNPVTSAVGGVSKKTVTMLQLKKIDREDGMTLQSALEACVTAFFVSTVCGTLVAWPIKAVRTKIVLCCV